MQTRKEESLGSALTGKRRDDLISSTKFGFTFGPNGEELGSDSSPEHIENSLQGPLRRLRKLRSRSRKRRKGYIGPTIYRHLTSCGHYLRQTLAPIDEMPGHKRWQNYCCCWFSITFLNDVRIMKNKSK